MECLEDLNLGSIGLIQLISPSPTAGIFIACHSITANSTPSHPAIGGPSCSILKWRGGRKVEGGGRRRWGERKRRFCDDGGAFLTRLQQSSHAALGIFSSISAIPCSYLSRRRSAHHVPSFPAYRRALRAAGAHSTYNIYTMLCCWHSVPQSARFAT